MLVMTFVHEGNYDSSTVQVLLTIGPLPCIDCELITHFAWIRWRAIMMRAIFEIVGFKIRLLWWSATYTPLTPEIIPNPRCCQCPEPAFIMISMMTIGRMHRSNQHHNDDDNDDDDNDDDDMMMMTMMMIILEMVMELHLLPLTKVRHLFRSTHPS